MSDLKEFLKLLKYGFVDKKEMTFYEILKFSFNVLLIIVLLKIALISIIIICDWFNIFEKPINIHKEEVEKNNFWLQILIVVIIGPIIEEFTFRGGLIFSKENFLITITGLFYFTIRNIFSLDVIASIAISLIVGLIIYGVQKKLDIKFLSYIWTENRKLIFYLLLIVFSLLHLNNYEINEIEQLSYLSVLLLPHFFGGIVYSYVRLKSGIMLAIIFHSLHNLAGFIL